MATVTWLAWKQTFPVVWDLTGVCRQNYPAKQANLPDARIGINLVQHPENPPRSSIRLLKIDASNGPWPSLKRKRALAVRQETSQTCGEVLRHIREFPALLVALTFAAAGSPLWGKFATENLKEYQHCSRLSFSRCIIATLRSNTIRENCVIDVDRDSITLRGGLCGKTHSPPAPTQSTALYTSRFVYSPAECEMTWRRTTKFQGSDKSPKIWLFTSTGRTSTQR